MGNSGVESMTDWEVPEWERKAIAPSSRCMEAPVGLSLGG